MHKYTLTNLHLLEVQAAGGKIPRSKLARDTKTKVATPKLKDVPSKPAKLSKGDLRKSLKARTTWWNSLTHNEQKSYLKEHPKSELKLKHSVAPKLSSDPKENNGKKTKKDSKKAAKQGPDTKSKKFKVEPITKNKKTTKLFKVDQAAVNAVPETEQQNINKEVEDAFSDHSLNTDSEVDDEVEDESEDENKENEGDEPNNELDTDNEGDEQDDLNSKIDKQLHPKQKINFIKAARTLISKTATKAEKEKAMQSMTHLSTLMTLTKIAGAAGGAALAYHFGSAQGAQCATFFALHHSQNMMQDSSAKMFLKKWAHKRFTGEEYNDKEFDSLLGIAEHIKHKTTHGGGGHKKHH